MRSAVLGVLGFFLGALVRVWVATLRLKLEVHRDARVRGVPRVYAFFHGQQMALLKAPRGRQTCVLVSLSRDGALQSGVMSSLGFVVRRGSSSRGGSAGVRGVLRELKEGADAAFAVDGPRGPRGVSKPGAARAAELGRAVFVPVASASSRAVVVRGAWDRFEVPLPFSRVAVVVGAPVDAAWARSHPEGVSDAIAISRARAEDVLGELSPEQGPWHSETHPP